MDNGRSQLALRMRSLIEAKMRLGLSLPSTYLAVYVARVDIVPCYASELSISGVLTVAL